MALVKYNNNSISGITSAPNVGSGNITLIKTITASSDSTISFVDGSSDVVLDNTYPIYLFKLINIHPGTDNVHLQVNFSTNSGSNYNVTKTTTYFRAYHDEGAGGGVLAYDTGFDLAQSTAFHDLTADSVSTDNDYGVSGFIHLFDPSNTTFAKHFIANIQSIKSGSSPESKNSYSTGYGNTTSAVDAIQFKFDSGNIDAGTIKMYGVA